MKNPFRNLLAPYFDFLSSSFEPLAEQSVKHNVQPDDIAWDYLSDARRKEVFNNVALPELAGYTVSFWQRTLDKVLDELKITPGLKASFGGDIGPQNRNNLYQRCGVYFDTIVVPDPILRTVGMPGPNRLRDYYLLKFAINLILHKDVYLADSYPPIAVLVGERHYTDGNDRDHWQQISSHASFDSVLIANAIFAKSFDTFDEAESFFKSFHSDEEVSKEVVEPDTFYLDSDAAPTFIDQLAAADKETLRHMDLEDMPSQMKGPVRVWNLIHARMMQINDVLDLSSKLEAHPVIQAPVSFHWLQTKVKENSKVMSEAMENDLQSQLPLTNALLSSEMEWLSNIPTNELVRLRTHGFLEDLRKTIGGNINELSGVDLRDLQRVTRQVDYNLTTALNRHQDQLQDVHNKAFDGLVAAVPPLLAAIGGSIQPLFGIVPCGYLSRQVCLVDMDLRKSSPD